MKKTLSIISLLLILFNLTSPIFAEGESNEEEGYFVVTAYYSPLPNQKYYYTGNYESEVKLNGNGTHGASGKEVFSGMLAAPKTYEFGTKVYLEGLGVGEVSDRGGAIVSAGNRGYSYDRIDLWVGYGDEGLARALYWGKRTLKGYIVHSSQSNTINIENLPTPEWATAGLVSTVPTIFDDSIGKESDSELIIQLQNFLKEIGLYNGEIDGKYNSKIIDIIYNFQLENGIVSKETDAGAGYWGQTTREKFKQAYLNGEFDKGDNNNTENFEDSKTTTQEETETTNTKIPMTEVNMEVFERALNYSADHVKEVQTIMQKLGLYDGAIDGRSSTLTNPIYNYQLSKGIVKSWSSAGAGQYGPMTRDALKEDYLAYLEKQAQEEKLKEAELIKQQEEKAKEEELIKQQEEAEKRKVELQEKYEKIKKEAIEKAVKEIEPIYKVKYGESSQAVREFQLFLKQLGYFSEKDTGNFGEKTKVALMNFQVDYGIIKSKDEKGAGEMTDETVFMIVNIRARGYIKELIKASPEKDLLVFL